MGFIVGLVKRIIRIFIYFVILASIIALVPNLPPYTSFSKIELEPQLQRTGPLSPNNDLNNVQKLYTGKLLGPECFQLYKGEVYTSLATGEIVKLSLGGHVTFVTQIGKPCTGIKEEHICGRPLGFVIDEKKNLLYVADAYYGIWSVDLGTNKKTLLVSPNVEISGHIPKIFNSVALDSKGNLYYTTSTSEFNLNDGAFSMMTDPTGRLYQYNAAKNESKVLIDNIWFANGLVVSPNDEFIVVSETGAFRLNKYYLSGPKKGQKEVFLAGLPGNPDNLRVLPDGSGLQVALYSVYGDDEPVLARSLAATPLVRKFLVRLQYLIQSAFQFLNQHFPHVFFEDIIYDIGHFRSLSPFLTSSTGVVHVDWNGNIINSYFHTEGKVFVSDCILYNDKVYLGQPHGQDFVGAVPAPPSFKKAFTPKDQPQAKKQAEKPAPVKVEKKPEAPKATPPPKTTTTPPPKTTTTPPPKTTTPPPPKTTTPPPPKTTTPPPPKTTTPPPKTTTPPPTKPTTQAPKTTQPPTTTPKPVEKTPPPAKPAQKVEQKPEKPAPKSAEKQKPDAPNAKAPQQIPIKEDLPSDTVKPNKETLKVITKSGPAEIPNPEL